MARRERQLTGRAHLAPVDTADPNEYREIFGAHVVESLGRYYLSMGNGMAGVAVPSEAALRVLSSLDHGQACGPVLVLSEVQTHWVFLTDPNGIVLAQADMPKGVRLFNCPTMVPLPGGDARAPGRWVVRPRVNQRWLPTLAAVLAPVFKASAMRMPFG